MDIYAVCDLGITVKEEIVENDSTCGRGITPVVCNEPTELNTVFKEESHDGVCMFSDTKEERDAAVSVDAQIPNSDGIADYGTSLKSDPDLEELLLDLGTVHSYNLIDTPESGFMCGICGLTAQRKVDLEQHMDSHIADEEEPSSNSSGNIKETKMPRKTSDTRNQFICHICNHRSHTKRLIKKHIDISHLAKKPYSCKSYESTPSRVAIKKNAQAHRKQKPETFICDFCGHWTSQRSELKVHILLKHTDEKPYACNLCDYRSAVEHYLKMHLLKCMGGKPFACDLCDYRCRQSRSLKAHKLKHNQDSLPSKKLKVFECHLCDYKTNTKSVLKKHLLRHLGEKQHACEICDYRCVEKQRLKIHMLTHTGEKPFRCDICDYSCRQRVHLRDHMKLHCGEKKSFFCYLCGYRCMHKKSLRDHMVDHGIYPRNPCDPWKPYSCEYCDFSSNHSGHVKDHMRVHTGEKPFACDLCDYRARQKGGLTTHMRMHAGGKPYSCDFCDYRSRQKGHVKVHMKIYCINKPKACDPLSDHSGSVTGPARNKPAERDNADAAKPYSCDSCYFRSRHKGHVNKHIKTYCPNKPKTCDALSDHSSVTGSVTRSPRNTTVERGNAAVTMPYSCDFCDYRSCEKGLVNSHMKIDCQNKPNTFDPLSVHRSFGSVTESPRKTSAKCGNTTRSNSKKKKKKKELVKDEPSVSHSSSTEINAVVLKQNFDHDYCAQSGIHRNPLRTTLIVAEPCDTVAYITSVPSWTLIGSLQD